MTAALIAALLLIPAAFLLGRRTPARRKFNEGVAVGRAAECREHGWMPAPSLAVPKPKLWPSLNRKPVAPFVSADVPHVLDDMPRHI